MDILKHLYYRAPEVTVQYFRQYRKRNEREPIESLAPVHGTVIPGVRQGTSSGVQLLSSEGQVVGVIARFVTPSVGLRLGGRGPFGSTLKSNGERSSVTVSLLDCSSRTLVGRFGEGLRSGYLCYTLLFKKKKKLVTSET